MRELVALESQIPSSPCRRSWRCNDVLSLSVHDSRRGEEKLEKRPKQHINVHYNEETAILREKRPSS